MRRELQGGYEIDDARERVDLGAAHAFLTEAYWSEGRTLETVGRLVANAARVVAIYRRAEMVAFCRVESDEVTFAMLLDVFVLPDQRGRGLGVELVREAVELGPHADLWWELRTRRRPWALRAIRVRAARPGAAHVAPPEPGGREPLSLGEVSAYEHPDHLFGELLPRRERRSEDETHCVMRARMR